MAKAPAISVIIIAHNSAEVLPRTLKSLREQEEDDFELLIIDDGSTDGTWSLITSIDMPRLRAHHNRTPAGAATGIVRGLAWAAGEFVVIHDAGAVSTPDRFKKQADRLGKDDPIAAIASAAEWVNSTGEPLQRVELPVQHEYQLNNLREESSPLYVAALQGAVMLRMEAIEEAGGHRASLGPASLLDLWMRVGEVGKLATFKQVFYAAPFDLAAPAICRRAEVEAYTALARKLAEERDSGGKEITDVEAAVEEIRARYDELGFFQQRIARTEGMLDWIDTLQEWGGPAAAEAQQLRTRARTTWPLSRRLWTSKPEAPQDEA